MRFFFVPALVLTVGLVHGELTALLWGGAFGFVWAYTVVAGLVSRFWVRPEGTVTTTPTSLFFRTPAVPTAPALFSWTLVVEGRHSAQRKFVRTVPLLPETAVALDLPRGRYTTSVRWELTDLFGFSRVGPRYQWTTEVVVAPVPRPFVPPRPPVVPQGNWQPRRTGRRAGDPFDVRRYHPGDDLRRLHWALYAHSGLPFVRTADPSPPPTGRWHLVLDTEAVSEVALDHRLGALAFWLADLDARGTPWELDVPSAGLVVSSAQEWRGPLAVLSPAKLPEGPAGPSHGLTLVTGPGSTRWSGIPRVVIDEPAATADPKRPWWVRP